jgi:predicted nuclease of restriction endonuclease-like (RecB) superfamily
MASDSRLIHFQEVLQLITQSRYQTLQSVNRALIDLYWQVGRYISLKVHAGEWGKSVVAELARFIKDHYPEVGGFSDKNLWRMKQFYEAYYDQPKLSTLLREIAWSAHLQILAKTKRIEEKEFYLRKTRQEHYSVRELDRQLNSGLFERTILADQQRPFSLQSLPQDLTGLFRDTYVFEFLRLPLQHSEKELQKGLVQHLCSFMLEAGEGFTFVEKTTGFRWAIVTFLSICCFFTVRCNAWWPLN